MANKETTRTSPKRKRKRPFFLRGGFWLAVVLTLFGLAILGGIVGLVGYRYLDNYTKPYRERAATYDLDKIDEIELPSLIVDRNGKEIGRFFVQNRSVISIDEVSEIFIDALRAGEDQRFYEHDGVDYIGVARAAYLNFKAGETTQGASTITQQLARNAYDLEGERKERGETGMQRKMVEAFLAMRIEERYSKREILEFYLNRIYFGSGYYGIRSASLGYFGKEPSELNALESAAIVGCIKNPTNLSPLNDLEANRKSRNLVIGRMVDLGAITRKEARELKESRLKLNPQPLRRGTTHLYERIAEEVGKVMGDEGLAEGGYTIHTTILSPAQTAAEKTLEEVLSRAESRPEYAHQRHGEYVKNMEKDPEYVQGACLMVHDGTGEVLVHVGGRDYAESPYDFIESGTKPLGTAFFPFIYAAALQSGMLPTHLLEDEPMDNRSVMVSGRVGILGEWGMELIKPRYEGKVTLRRALEASKIAATVRLVDKIGLERLVQLTAAYGLPIADAELLRRIAVGFEPASLKQLMRAMSVFGHGGTMDEGGLIYLNRIVDVEGVVIYQRSPEARSRTRVTDEVTAFQIHDMLVEGGEHGSARGLYEGMAEGFKGAGKGGTTHDFGDTWFAGYSSGVNCAVWTGFLNNMGEGIYTGAFSRDLAMPVWQAAMNAAEPWFPSQPIAQPENVVAETVCAVSGQRPTDYCLEYVKNPETQVEEAVSTARTEYFRQQNSRLPYCQYHAGANPDLPDIDIAELETSVVDAVPVRPQSPVLIGDDPYHSALPAFAKREGEVGFVPRRTSVLDSLDLSQQEEKLYLPRPERLTIYDR